MKTVNGVWYVGETFDKYEVIIALYSYKNLSFYKMNHWFISFKKVKLSNKFEKLAWLNLSHEAVGFHSGSVLDSLGAL